MKGIAGYLTLEIVYKKMERLNNHLYHLKQLTIPIDRYVCTYMSAQMRMCIQRENMTDRERKRTSALCKAQ